MIAIIANPNALRFNSRQLKQICSMLNRNALVVHVFFTQRAGDGTKIAGKIASKYSIIAAYGGDGIINEIINANLGSSALGILPAGTTNVLALDMGIPINPLEAAKLFINPVFKDIYVGKINNRKFILMSGLGFDGLAVANVNPELKKVSGKFAYFFSGIIAYLQYKNSFITLKVENKIYKARWAVVSNAKKYAGNYNISDIDIDKPMFDVCLFKPAMHKAIDLPLHNLLLFSSFHKKTKWLVKHIETDKKIGVSKTHIQIDGDYIGFSDAEISICEKTYRLVVP
jgi:diacylglycerol kinase (ATP)